MAGNSDAKATVLDATNYMTAIGQAWRGDWSDADGRTIRDQFGTAANLAIRAAKGELTCGDIDAAIRAEGACPECWSWTDYCGCPSEEAKP